MALFTQSSFSSGEIDPALHERTNLQKYSAALATARNVLIGKTGRLISRPGRRNFVQCKESDSKVITHSMPSIGVLLEWGDEYVRVYDTSGNLIDDIATDWGEDDLKYLTFQNIGDHLVLVTFAGDDAQLFLPLAEVLFMGIYSGAEFKTTFTQLPTQPSFVSNSGTGTGPDIDYCFTAVVNGEESAPYFDVATLEELCITAGQFCTVVGRYTGSTLASTYARHFYQFLGSTDLTAAVTEFRFYRRPAGGGSYGYVGSSVAYAVTAGSGYPSGTYYIDVTFKDFGQDADYSHQPPLAVGTIAVPGFSSIETTTVRAACTYQQRLILCLNDVVLASRTGFPLNFYRDFPYSADSALSFNIGGNGSRRILRAIESDGLAIFATDGVYRHTGVLSPDNLACPKLGEWVIDADTSPIAVPGGVLFVDAATNTVRRLMFSQERGSYIAEELSIFSNHLFNGNRVKSWTFQQGDTPVLWVVFADGTMATFTYEPEHEMKAWARHDSVYPIEHVHFMPASPPNGIFEPLEVGQTFFVVNKDGQRFIEIGVPRFVSASITEENPEADKNHSIAAIDGMATWENLLNDDLEGDDEFVLEPVTPDDWEGQLTLTCGTSEIFKAEDLTQVGEPGPGVIGQVLRWFHPVDLWSMDFTIDEVTSENEVIVTPSEEFPLAYAEGLRLYLTTDILRPQYRYNLDEQISGGATGFITEATPVDTINWDTPLTLNSSDPIFTDPGPGTVGTILAHDSTDFGYNILLQVLSRASDFQIVVQPVGFMTDDITESNDMELWTTVAVPTYSISHLDDEDVSIIVDGAVKGSPNNNIENYGEHIVTDGLLAIPDDERGAIIHVGRPYVMDVETLDIDTVEQRPILLESETVNKVYLKVLNSRGLYAAANFPADDTLSGLLESGIVEVQMEDTDTIFVDHEAEVDLPGNRYDRPRTVRREISLKGKWSTNGRVALRQVDPIHFEILSIIPDIEGLRRGP